MDNFSKSDIDKSFGKLIKDYRLAKNMTQDELAEALNISEKYILCQKNTSPMAQHVKL